MITNPKSDTRRQVVPLPNGQRPTREQGVVTMLRLTDQTGLTTKRPGAPLGRTIEKDNVLPGFARLFNALPGVTPSDFTPAARPLLTRN